MDIETNDLGPCKKRLSVTITAERIDKSLETSYAALKDKISLPGFRPGKIPRRLLERRYGDHVKQDVTEELVDETIRSAVQELGLELVSPPELVPPEGADADEEKPPIQVAPGEDLDITFDVEIKPDFELPDYKGIAATRKVVAPDDEALDEAMKSRAENLASIQPFESYEAGDIVVADVEIFDGDEMVEDQEEVEINPGHPHVLGHHLDDFEGALEGKKAEDEVSLPVKSEDDKELRAKLHLLEFKRHVVPPLDDNLASELGFENLQALEDDTRKLLEERAKTEADRDVVQQVIDDILSRAEIPVAEGPVERMLERRTRQAYIELVIGGLDREAAEVQIEEQKDEIRASIEKDTRSWFLFEKIAKKEKIFCMESDVDQKIQDIAVESGSTPTKVREYYESKNMIADVRTGILEEKVCNFLRENAKISGEVAGDENEGEASGN